jgi:hypothetical protein
MTANRRRKLVGKFSWKTFLACNDEFTPIASFPCFLLEDTKLSVSVICVFLTPNPSKKQQLNNVSDKTNTLKEYTGRNIPIDVYVTNDVYKGNLLNIMQV